MALTADVKEELSHLDVTRVSARKAEVATLCLLYTSDAADDSTEV